MVISPPELSVVIPVYNGSRTIGPLVDRIHRVCGTIKFEVLLVNDGSRDESEATCRHLVDRYPNTVCFLQLSRNFGEHNAVLAGFSQARGDYIVVLDDDAQHAPDDVLRLLDTIKTQACDVVYGCFRVKHHHWLRNLGSWFNDRVANVMLRKPRGLYLSSFKILNRFLAQEIVRYHGAFPYIDGLILRTTDRIGQLDVAHHPRGEGKSNYTIAKLLSLWLNMFLNFSIVPLRLATLLGMGMAAMSLILLMAIVIDKYWINPSVTVGVPTILVTVVFFSGINLLIMGIVGEYLGRLFLDHSGTPQFVIRYIRQGERSTDDEISPKDRPCTPAA